jgi:Protein of unknown function (DUF2975)
MLNFTENPRIFQWLDRFFWLVWLAFPVLLWQTYLTVIDQSTLTDELPTGAEDCAALIPSVANFSAQGKASFVVYFVAQYVIYALLLWLAHTTIHRCAMGKVYVSDTLRTLGFLGVIVILWPVYELVTTNLLSYALTVTGDLKTYRPDFLFDVGPLGVGLLILAMRAVIGHAINIKQDNDLTI